MFVALTITGCGSPPPRPEPPGTVEARRIEASVSTQRVRENPLLALAELDRALRLYALADDLRGQQRLHLKRARLLLRLGRTDQARQHLQHALALSQADKSSPYRHGIELLHGRLGGGSQAYEAALAAATTPLQRAVALTYLQREKEAQALVRDTKVDADNADDLAFVAYSYARRNNDIAAASKALAAWKLAGNPVGIVDSLYLLGRLHLRIGENPKAASYLRRALTVARALDDQRRVRAILGTLKQV